MLQETKHEPERDKEPLPPHWVLTLRGSSEPFGRTGKITDSCPPYAIRGCLRWDQRTLYGKESILMIGRLRASGVNRTPTQHSPSTQFSLDEIVLLGIFSLE